MSRACWVTDIIIEIITLGSRTTFFHYIKFTILQFTGALYSQGNHCDMTISRDNGLLLNDFLN